MNRKFCTVSLATNRSMRPSLLMSGGHHAQAFAQGLLDVGAAAHFGEGAVAIVVKQQAGSALEHARDAVEMLPQLVVAAGKVLVLP